MWWLCKLADEEWDANSGCVLPPGCWRSCGKTQHYCLLAVAPGNFPGVWWKIDTLMPTILKNYTNIYNPLLRAVSEWSPLIPLTHSIHIVPILPGNPKQFPLFSTRSQQSHPARQPQTFSIVQTMLSNAIMLFQGLFQLEYALLGAL